MFGALTASLLIIDNNPALRLAFKNYFEDNGFTVIEAENGAEGLEIFRSQKPDLVVTALQMPVLGGLEVLRTLVQEYPASPVIIIAEQGDLEAMIQALRIGAWDYLTKPIHQWSVLEHALCRALERARLIEDNRIYRQQLEIANQALKKNLETLEQDQEAGRSVQMRLLPKQAMVFGSYHFSHHVAPSLYLSGDFIDYFAINEDQLAFYIADVSGHGASSAFVTVLLRSLVLQMLGRYQTQGDPMILHPEQVLSSLAEEIYKEKLGKYLTMVYGVIDRSIAQLSYSIAGHYPNPILLEAGEARFLSGSGFPAGIMEKTPYECYAHTLKPDTHLVLCSDGITEIITGSDLAQKEASLLAMVCETRANILSLVDHLDLKNKTNLPDDVTLLTIWCRPEDNS
ncbi:MAG: SpoIIE family protein phosphatase [Gammaproteobacteria bacterium]|nr:SpoIIE family protein phosphatase [Gammaproteobacteria bacterium]MBP9729508.1 SpoIIE family protein phosphatase [Gammaproteobacteria bacterium]